MKTSTLHYKKPHVLDGDGVVTDGGSQKSIAALQLFGVHIPPDQFTRANIKRTGLMTDENYETMKEVAYNDWKFASRFQFLPGCLPGLFRLDRLGVPIAIASRRKQKAASYMERLLWQHGLYNIPVFGTGLLYNKTELLEHLGGMASYTDDDVQCLGKESRHLFLLNQPHNLRQDCAHPRFQDWDQLFEKICELSGQVWKDGLPAPPRRFTKVRAVITEVDEMYGPRVLLGCRNGGSMDGWFEFNGGNIEEEDTDSLSATLREIGQEFDGLPEELEVQTLRLLYDPERGEYSYTYFFSAKNLPVFVENFHGTKECSKLILPKLGDWPDNLLPTMREHLAPRIVATVCDLVDRQPRLIR